MGAEGRVGVAGAGRPAHRAALTKLPPGDCTWAKEENGLQGRKWGVSFLCYFKFTHEY